MGARLEERPSAGPSPGTKGDKRGSPISGRIVLLTVVVVATTVAVIIALWFFSFLPARKRKAETRRYSQMCHLAEVLAGYSMDYGTFPPAFSALQDYIPELRDPEYSEYFNGIVYTYFLDKRYTRIQPSPGLSPIPALAPYKVWFYYPLPDGKVWICFGGAVRKGTIEEVRDAKEPEVSNDF